jgi:hypothetical protein
VPGALAVGLRRQLGKIPFPRANAILWVSGQDGSGHQGKHAYRARADVVQSLGSPLRPEIHEVSALAQVGIQAIAMKLHNDVALPFDNEAMYILPRICSISREPCKLFLIETVSRARDCNPGVRRTAPQRRDYPREAKKAPYLCFPIIKSRN